MEVLQGKTVQKERGLPKGWKEVKLNQVAEIDKESLPGNTNKSYEFDYISLSDVDSNSLRIETSKQVFENAPSRARRIVRKGDVLMSTVRPNLQGFTIIRNEVINLIASTGFAVIRPKSIISEFLFQYLFSGIISKQFYSLLVGSNYPAINSSDVKNLKILLPPLPEQQAIADCLSTWDGAIQATQQLIRQKELQKKWLMQQLLTGKKRLKGFSEEWEERKLGELCNISKGEQLNKIELTKFGDYPSFSGGVNPSGYTEKWNTYENTIIISEGGNSCGFVNFMRTKFWSGGHCYSLLELKKSISTTFLFQTLKYREPSIMKLRVGSGLPNVQKKDIEAFVLLIPPFEEQQAIASILSESNRELDLLRKRLAKLQEQKKGLMQVLLTGKRRLRIKEL
jgi:type I restriction enzyme S subunit